MPHHLFIIRHAQTHSNQYYNSDKARALKPEGIAEATNLGKFLKASDYKVNRILSSHAERAKATAELMAAEINYPIDQIQLDEKIYSGSMHDLLALIWQTPNSVEHLAMIGHYPTIVELNNYLCNSQKVGMQAAELTLIRFEINWSEIFERSGEHKLNYRPLCQ